MSITKEIKGRFAKGVSGNPAGRPKGAGNKLTLALAEVAQVYTQEALETLVSIMRNTKIDPKVRVVAAAHILDRGWGKPDVIYIRESQAQITHYNGGFASDNQQE